jgi:AbrB family looped-hinge helix DNA binding protein
MALSKVRITAQGQISIPAAARKKLGLRPGAVLECKVEGDAVVFRRAGTYSLEDLHRTAFPNGKPKPKTLEELNEGIGEYMRKRYAKR